MRVFCFRVTSVGLHIDERCHRNVMFLSERPAKADESTAWSVLDQTQVPPNALWLICDHGDLDLCDGWERSGSGRQTATTPAASAGDVLTKTIKRRVRREAAAKIGIWALVALTVPVLALLAVPDFWVQRETVVAFSANWVACVFVLALFVLVRASVEHFLGRRWRPRDGQTEEWTGRTTWALAAGRMVSQVTFLAGKRGQDLWNSEWPQDCPTETMGCEHCGLGADQLE